MLKKISKYCLYAEFLCIPAFFLTPDPYRFVILLCGFLFAAVSFVTPYRDL